MAALSIEHIDKILEEPMVDYDFGDEWDDENVDPDFQIDSDHNTDSEEDCDPSESPHNNDNIENEIIEAIDKNLSLSLVKESLVQRAHNKHLPTLLRQSAKRLSGIKECTQVLNKGKRGRCYYCKSDSKTQYYCKDCQKWLCIKHAKFVCEEYYSEVHNL